MITDYIGGEGSAETPKNDYVIYGWPLTRITLSTTSVPQRSSLQVWSLSAQDPRRPHSGYNDNLLRRHRLQLHDGTLVHLYHRIAHPDVGHGYPCPTNCSFVSLGPGFGNRKCNYSLNNEYCDPNCNPKICRWTRRTSTRGVWSVKSAMNSKRRATSPTKTSRYAKRTTRFARWWWPQRTNSTER